MFMNQAVLRDLCVRVAAGDQRAREQFDRHIPPLVEVVVRRWLRQQGKEMSTATADLARQLTGECCARMIGNCQSSRWPNDRWAEDTVASRHSSDTFCWSVAAATA
jgi:hypothetical protein